MPSFPRLPLIHAAFVLCGFVIAGFAAVAAGQQSDEATSISPDSTELPSSGDADEKAEPEYVRIQRNDEGLAAALQTSVIRLSESDQFPDTQVDLIGAIHLGEAGYYKTLNERFKDYDALLFEAVMPEEAVERGYRPGGGQAEGGSALSDQDQWTEAQVGMAAISVLQLGMKDALGLEFQLTGVNYNALNFVHADMTAEEFASTMERRGESFSSMLVNEMSKSMTSQKQQDSIAMNLDLMLSLLTSDRLYRVRRIAAKEIAKADSGEAFASEDGTSTIITERNIKALQILRRELGNGKKKIGIFYGAGHLSDMEQRMVTEFGYKRQSEEWVTAWKLRDE